MRVRQLHPWNVSPREAMTIQNRMRRRLRFPQRRRDASRVAAADLSATPGNPSLYAVVVVLSWPGLDLIECHAGAGPAPFPYVPGLLSFREIPLLLPLFRRLRRQPDLLLCDGQGIAHPRGFGLASHLGLLLGIPTIGCAKSRLVGRHREPGPQRGSSCRLLVDAEPRGAVVRTRAHVNPIFVSPGHLISIKEAVRWSLLLSPRYRIPEPIRQAHTQVNIYRQK